MFEKIFAACITGLTAFYNLLVSLRPSYLVHICLENLYSVLILLNSYFYITNIVLEFFDRARQC